MAETWSSGAYHRGAVVLNFIGARTSSTDRTRYERVLATLT